MANVGSAASNDPSSDYPLANSEATRMLAAAFEKVSAEKGWSQRQIAQMLNYKTSVVLSHMALGRIPIPIDRALDYARLLGMDRSKFLLAVLEQRHPEIDFLRVLGATAKQRSTGKGGRESHTLEELETLAGKPLDELPPDRINIMREVVASQDASPRWLSLQELPTVELIRSKFPSGLTAAQRSKLSGMLENL